MVLPSLVLYFYHKKYSYKRVLKISVVLGGLLPPLSLLLVHQPALYQYLFVLSGIYLALYRIAINGILIEISNDENRTFFAGISGAGNILASLLPVFSGMFILWFGYTAVFLVLAFLIFSGYYFASRLECSAAGKNN
jgi:MFS family permease